MKRWLLVPVATVLAVSPAIAGVETWSSESGKTEFTMPLVIGCDSPRQPSSYTTEFQGVVYSGKFWAKQASGCRSRTTTLSGYFEERNRRTGEWCRGNLTLNFQGDRGTATWKDIQAVNNYSCSGAGKSFSLPLIQIGP